MRAKVKNLGWSLFPRYMAKQHFYKNNWAEIEQTIVPMFLNKTSDCIDIGANCGRYTALMSMFSRSVHAFEPNPECITLLKELCLPNAHIYPHALSREAGASEYFMPIKNGVAVDTHGTLDRAALSTYSDVNTFKVETATLDSLGTHAISFIKIDVEGHEMDVLYGGQTLIADQNPVVLVEAEERHRANAVQEVSAFFRNLNYQGFYVLDQKIYGMDSFHADLQNPEELQRPVSRAEMGYINNFIFLPSSSNVDAMVKQMDERLGDEQLRWTLM